MTHFASLGVPLDAPGQKHTLLVVLFVFVLSHGLLLVQQSFKMACDLYHVRSCLLNPASVCAKKAMYRPVVVGTVMLYSSVQVVF